MDDQTKELRAAIGKEATRTLIVTVPEENVEAVLKAANMLNQDDVSGFVPAPIIDITGTGCHVAASGGNTSGGRGDIQCGDADDPASGY